MPEEDDLHKEASAAYAKWLAAQPKEGAYRSHGAQMAFLEAFKLAKTGSTYTEQQEAVLGEKLADIFRLRRSPENSRYLLGGGYNTKTDIGLFRAIRELGRLIEKGLL